MPPPPEQNVVPNHSFTELPGFVKNLNPISTEEMRKTLKWMISAKYPQHDSKDKKKITSELNINPLCFTNILRATYLELRDKGLVYNRCSKIEYHPVTNEWLDPNWDGCFKKDMLPTAPTNSVRLPRTANSQKYYGRQPVTLHQPPAPRKPLQKKRLPSILEMEAKVRKLQRRIREERRRIREREQRVKVQETPTATAIAATITATTEVRTTPTVLDSRAGGERVSPALGEDRIHHGWEQPFLMTPSWQTARWSPTSFCRDHLPVSQVDQELFDYFDSLLGVNLRELRINPTDFSYTDTDSDYGDAGFPCLFDHGWPIKEWKQFNWTYTNTGYAADKSTKEARRIGIKFIYDNLPSEPFTGLFAGFAWLLIKPENGQQSLSLERVVLALDDSRSSGHWPNNQETRELINLTRLRQLVQQLADGIQRKLSPLYGRCKDNILFSFALPEFSFAKLEEGADFDTLSPLDVIERIKELEQEGIQVSKAPKQRQTARSRQLRNNFTIQQTTPEPESDSARLVKVARLYPFPPQLLSEELRSLYGSQNANFHEVARP